MARIVANKCFGGFSVSRAAIVRLRELGHEEAMEVRLFGEADGPNFNIDSYGHDFVRDDARLVQVVAELGKAAGGAYAQLAIVEVPDGCAWEIDEYDGLETVREPSREWG